jgi:hypothetical protein
MDGVARDDYAWSAGDCAYLEDAGWSLVRDGDGEAQQGRIP